jgi:hypothetical protein
MTLVGTLECNRLTDRGFQQLQRAGVGIKFGLQADRDNRLISDVAKDSPQLR